MRFSFSAVGAALAALATCAAAFPQRPHFGRPHPELYRPGGRYAPRPYYAHPLWVSSAGEDGAPDDSSPEDSGPGSSGSGSGNGGPGNSGPPGGSGPGGSGPSGGNGGPGRSGPPGGNPGRTFTQQLPASLNPPAGARFIISFFAAGTQNYVCNTTGTPTWSLDRPEAFLYPANADAFVPQAQPIGFHFFLNGTGDSGGGRATWTLTRAGARVTTKLLANAPSPDGPANIPWLLTQTTTSSRSAPGNPLQNVGFVVRYSTTSGVAPPADQCTAEKSGIVKRMPYSALYGFFEPAPSSGAGASSSPS